MKTLELWTEVIPKPQDKNSNLINQIWFSCINYEGTITVVVVGDAILVYDSNSGHMISKPLRGAHKEKIN